jgi:ATP/maltotriose-dependent transcriptional regulator MalT
MGDRLEAGRVAYAQGRWAAAADGLAEAAEPEDLLRLAAAEYMLGREDAYVALHERAQQAYETRGDLEQAARTAVWIGLFLGRRGEMGRAGGWIGRGERLLEAIGHECVAHAYLSVIRTFMLRGAGDFQGAEAAAGAAVELAQRHGDRDLFALAMHSHGHMLVEQGRLQAGLRMFDEAMLAVTAGEVSPVASGIVYCGVITGCRDAFASDRAREWTQALTRWCDRQPDLVSFSGQCLVHRAEILQLDGAWVDALAEAERAAVRCRAVGNDRAEAEAAYVRGDVHRMRGEYDLSAAAYREAGVGGHEPQPGLALLRAAEGDLATAARMLQRALAEAEEPPRRISLLPASVEVLLAAGDTDGAAEAAGELEALAAPRESAVVTAMAVQARGEVLLARGDGGRALACLRRAWRTWHDAGAPYDAARVRVRIALACRELGDEETAAVELEGARAVFERLGAAPARLRVEGLLGGSTDPHGLTARELQVLRLVASGETNRAIASELVLSERTVDRHVSNIFTKLRVSTRSAATARAYEDRLL